MSVDLGGDGDAEVNEPGRRSRFTAADTIVDVSVVVSVNLDGDGDVDVGTTL